MTLEDAQAWAKEVMRQRYRWVKILFGEKKPGTGNQEPETRYCEACKAAKKDDCKKCDRKIEEIKDRLKTEG